MIKVTCVVENANKKSKDYLLVESCDDIRDGVYISVERTDTSSGPARIHVYADDLIQAVENCRNNGFRRFPTRYNYSHHNRDEDEE